MLPPNGTRRQTEGKEEAAYLIQVGYYSPRLYLICFLPFPYPLTRNRRKKKKKGQRKLGRI
jgi:hypothetical protein